MSKIKQLKLDSSCDNANNNIEISLNKGADIASNKKFTGFHKTPKNGLNQIQSNKIDYRKLMGISYQYDYLFFDASNENPLEHDEYYRQFFDNGLDDNYKIDKTSKLIIDRFIRHQVSIEDIKKYINCTISFESTSISGLDRSKRFS